MSGTFDKLVDQRDLLEILRQHPLTAPFNLAFYSAGQTNKELTQAIHSVCSPAGIEKECLESCFHVWKECVSQAIESGQPQVRVCEQSFLCFAVPLLASNGLPDCLMGGGIIEHTTTIHHHAGSPENSDLLTETDNFPQLISVDEAEAVTEEIVSTLPHLLNKQIHALSLSRTTQRLQAVQKLTRDLAVCGDAEKAVEIVSEALIVLFNLPKIMIVLQQSGQSMTIHSTLGLAPDSFQVDQKRLSDYLKETEGYLQELAGNDLANFFPGLDTQSAYLFPLGGNEAGLGTIVILDITLHTRDLALIELLINSLATRLGNLRTAENHHQERQFSSKLVSMISSLSLVNSRKELYRQILEMSSELLTATSGSLMLLNEDDGSLNIEAAKGMTSSLAKTMSVSFGEGIAGKVAKSGFPMLVNDIERDKRVAARNRPRFKTKSFVSLPLETEKNLVGVLNLADKSDGTNFTEADLGLIQTFTGHAVLMIERAAMLEKAGKFEQLAITDPLSGLYNRRLLEERLQEELSRSERQQLSFCIIMADLDSFKVYNDICGHLAGDNALRKAANLISSNARDMDVVTRYGGEEFCLILPATSKKESVFVGERIRRAIEAESFPGESHLPLGRLTISVGVAAFPFDGVTANELVHAADLALYRAKAMGRNRLALYEPSLETQSFPANLE